MSRFLRPSCRLLHIGQPGVAGSSTKVDSATGDFNRMCMIFRCRGLSLAPAKATQLKNLRMTPSTRKTLVSVKFGTSSQIRCACSADGRQYCVSRKVQCRRGTDHRGTALRVQSRVAETSLDICLCGSVVQAMGLGTEMYLGNCVLLRGHRHLVGVVDALRLQLEVEEGAVRKVRLQQLLRQEAPPLQLQARLHLGQRVVLGIHGDWQ